MFDNLVGGRWTSEHSSGRIEVRDPADMRTVVATVPEMSSAAVDALYECAARGAAEWRGTPALDRAAVLAQASRLLRMRVDEIATDLVHEMGKTFAEACNEVEKSADFFEYYASMARLPSGYLLNGSVGTQTSVRTEPIGIVLAITPWNDPLLTPARKLAPALAAGNAVILKPATNTPLAALHLARALDDAGLPAGVLGTATGRVAVLSPALLGDSRLAAVSFTGSNDVGAQLRRALVDSNVRLQTELGGKNAAVVLPDADLELAAATIEAAAFGQSGQRCTATSRCIVARSVRTELLELLVDRAQVRQLGHGLDPTTTMGPVASIAQQESVLGHLKAASAAGATVVTGGEQPTEASLRYGCFVEPTVLVDVNPEMLVWREEVFGPVLGVLEVDDLDGAIAAVNDSPYGLSAAVFTRSLEQANRFADLVDTGQVAVNLPTSGWDVHVPFGGFRESGSAFKEQGIEGMRFYTRTKTVAVRYAT
jgi:acyl-CoA reductase-like NAD-dependent aldehyde dehydrogenase